MGAPAAARVDDHFGHSAAVAGTALGLSVAPFAIGALIGMAILTGGVSLIAVGAAIAITGGAGLAGEMIGSTIEGPETGRIKIGSRNVAINGRAAAMTVLATGHCSKDSGSPVPVATGAATVFINGQPAARIGEKMACSAVIREGSPNVFIGGPSVPVIVPTPEVPTLLHNVTLAMMWGGTAIGTLGVGLTYGAGAAIGSLAGGLGGSHLLGTGARSGAAALGYGATGQAVAEVAGGFVGGGIGGGLGFRGGMAGEAAIAGRLPPRSGSFRSLAESEAAADRVIAAGLKPERVPDGVPLSQKEFDYLRALPAAERPVDPSTYLPRKYIEQHLAQFDEGGSYLTPTHYLDRFGRDALGRDDGVFMMPKSEMDAVISRTGGDIGRIEAELGIDKGEWSQLGSLSRVDVPNPRALDLRIPNGREAGANSNWLPGAKLPGGGSEAVVNQIPKGMFAETIFGGAK